MVQEIRFTLHAFRVLRVFALKPGESFTGSKIATKLNLAYGTLYPLLARLEAAGLLQGQWEKANPKTLGRPRKKFYQITEDGQKRFHFETSRFDF